MSKKERCVHCNKKMAPWTVTCPNCGKVNGHNLISKIVAPIPV